MKKGTFCAALLGLPCHRTRRERDRKSGLMYLLAVAGSGIKGMLTVDVGDNSRRGRVSDAAECCDDCTIERGGGLGGLRVGQLLEVSDVICDRGVRGLYLLGCLLCLCCSNMIHIPITSKTTTVDKVAEISKKNVKCYPYIYL